MTVNELQNYLDEFREERKYIPLEIAAYLTHCDEIKKWTYIPAVTNELSYLTQSIMKQRERMERKTAVIQSWSELITNETYKKIFLDRYLNNETWETLEVKYHYCKSQIYNINRSVCSEIVSKNRLEICPDNQSQVISVST